MTTTMPDDFKNQLCQDYTSAVDGMSLHTYPGPGTTGDNDSGIHRNALVWTESNFGVSTTSTTFVNLTGHYSHIGLWEGGTFRQGIECPIDYDAPADVTITVVHEAGQE